MSYPERWVMDAMRNEHHEYGPTLAQPESGPELHDLGKHVSTKQHAPRTTGMVTK